MREKGQKDKRAKGKKGEEKKRTKGHKDKGTKRQKDTATISNLLHLCVASSSSFAGACLS